MDDGSTEVQQTAELAPTLERMPRIESRFLFVDVAAQRAKQLRRGALPRLQHLPADPETDVRPETPARLERVAMEEVREGLVVYELPERKPNPPEEAA